MDVDQGISLDIDQLDVPQTGNVDEVRHAMAKQVVVKS